MARYATRIYEQEPWLSRRGQRVPPCPGKRFGVACDRDLASVAPVPQLSPAAIAPCGQSLSTPLQRNRMEQKPPLALLWIATPLLLFDRSSHRPFLSRKVYHFCDIMLVMDCAYSWNLQSLTAHRASLQRSSVMLLGIWLELSNMSDMSKSC